METSGETGWDDLAEQVFGTTDPEVLKEKATRIQEFIAFEQTSLGHSLKGIRVRGSLTQEQAAATAEVPVEQWRAWEENSEIPTLAVLKAALERLGWGRSLDRFVSLFQQARTAR